jgi:hypothetical protein
VLVPLSFARDTLASTAFATAFDAMGTVRRDQRDVVRHGAPSLTPSGGDVFARGAFLSRLEQRRQSHRRGAGVGDGAQESGALALVDPSPTRMPMSSTAGKVHRSMSRKYGSSWRRYSTADKLKRLWNEINCAIAKRQLQERLSVLPEVRSSSF